MASPSAFTTGYKPTPLEQAYSLYILDVVLQVPREPFRLSGRVAVPFLNSSGVDRSLLREIWTVVDPTMEGSLVEIIQFTSLLKLVSLAQQRCLDMSQYEGQLLYRHVPLPTFLNLVVMPSHQLLMELYPSVTVNQVILAAPTEKLSVSDAFGDLAVDAPLPALTSVGSQDADEDFGDLQHAGGPTLDADDDFGDFEGGTAADQILTEEQQVVPEQGGSHLDRSEEFGDFTGTHAISTAGNHPSVGHDKRRSEEQSVPVNSALHFEHLPEQQQASLHVAKEVGDDFGDFEGTPLGTSSGDVDAANNLGLEFGGAGVFSEQTLPISSLAFDEIQPTQNQPLQSLRANEGQADDSFGQFHGDIADPTIETAILEAIPSVSNETHPAQFTGIPNSADDAAVTIDNSPFDAFEGIQPIEDQPLPAFDAMTIPALDADDVDADDDFGDFTGIPSPADHEVAPVGDATFGAFDGIQPIEDQPLPSLDALAVPSADDVHADDDFGDFTGIPSTGDHGVAPVGVATFGAYDGIQPIEDQPLPSLDALATPIAGDVVPDDDFGDFTGIPSTTDHVVATAGDSTFGAFGGIQPIEDQPLPSLDAMAIPTARDVIPDDDFGDFTGIPSTGVNGVAPVGETSFDAFDGIQTIEDQPLPSLDALATTIAGDVVPDDDFGDFTGIPSTTDHVVAPAGDSTFGAFGGIQPIEDQPLPSLDAMLIPTAGDVIPDDDFGDFTGIPSTGVNVLAPVGETSFDAFDGIQTVEDQPQPLLDAMAIRSANDAHAEDDFGDFTGIPSTGDRGVSPLGDTSFGAFDGIQPIEDQPLPSLDTMAIPPLVADDFTGMPSTTDRGVSDTLFGAFDGIQPIEDQPLPSLDAMAIPALVADDVDADDDFGDFTGNPSTTDHGVAPVGVATFGDFDGIQPIEDQPLPSLDAMAIPALVVDDVDADDDFGDFTGISTPADHEVAPLGDSTFGAFDGIQPIEDQPLPLLDPMAISSAEDVAPDDDFGDFTGFSGTGDNGVAPVGDQSFGAFDGIQPIEDQPLPSLDAMTIPAADDADADDDFGDFTGIPSTGDHGVAPVGDASFDAFDAIQPIEDQHMLSLDTMESPALVAADDDFGDFTGIPHADGRMAVPVDDSPFGAFDGIQPIENLPLHSLVAMVPSTAADAIDDDSFGDFTGIPDTNDTTETIHGPLSGAVNGSLPMQNRSSVPNIYDDGSSGFGHAAETVGQTQLDAVDGSPPVEDGPLPSLHAHSSPSLTREESADDVDVDLDDFSGIPDTTDQRAITTCEKSFDGIQSMANLPLPTPLPSTNPPIVSAVYEDYADDNFGDSIGISDAAKPVLPALSQQVSVDQASGADADPFSFFNTVDEGQSDRRLQPLSSYSFSTPHEPQTPDLPNDDSFGDFIAPIEIQSAPTGVDSALLSATGQIASGIDAPNSLHEPAFVDHVSAGLKHLEGSTVLEKACNTSAPHNLFDGPAALPGVSESEAEPLDDDDDDDWGDFEHVQAPSVPADGFCDFIVAPGPPKDSMVFFMTMAAPPPVESDAFASFPPETGDQTAVANSAVDFEANFGAFEGVHAAPQSEKASQAEEDFGDWDSFQDASPNMPVRPMSLDEIKGQLLSLTLPGSLTKIDLTKQLQENLLSKNWAYGGNSNSSLKRAKRCLDVVFVLSTSCSNLVCADWNRVLSAVRDEISMGSFLLQEAKKLPKGSHKDVLKPLSIMVSGLSEFVRVVRSIVATVGDVLCLDLQVPLSTGRLASAWQSLGIVQLALEVEDTWTGIEAISKALKLCVSSRLETIETIRKKAIESKSTSLCQLTLQPLSHEDSTKNEVIWEGKPFMACAANLWSNRVSDTVPYST